MCLVPRIVAALGAVICLAAATSPSASDDPVLPLLVEEDYAQARPRILEALRQPGVSPCRALGAYATARNRAVREHAVRALADAGCADFEAYRGYAADGDAWVIDAVIRAATRQQMTGAVPFLLARLSDPRRIVVEEGTWTIGDSAHHGLQVITCQSFHYDPGAPADDRRNALTRWRQWYLEHRGEPRDAWVKAGIERARDYAGRDYGPHRLEGLRLLVLIGDPALPALRDLLGRSPGDLRADVSCQPEEPPRPADQVPCTLVVRNVSARHVAIAPPPGGPEVRVSRSDATAEADAASAPDPLRSAADGNPAASGGTGALLAALAGRLDDLSPGAVRRYEFKVGPVPAAGRYRVRAALADGAATLTAAPGPRGAAASPARAAPSRAPGAIEAETIVRFDQ
jgi:hypothetical protein